jgi:outer membrane protein OmpA-like peptidoglycan-associated protein
LLDPPPSVDLSLENGILTAEGTASPEWFAGAKKIAAAVPGVKEFRIGFASLKAEIESKSIAFNCGTTDFAENQAETLNRLMKDFEALGALAKSGQKSFRAEIEGHADASGTSNINARISQARADKILEVFFAKSAYLKQYNQNFKAVGVGAEGNLSECAVRFRVFLE